ncbi:eukaryotic translation initiation factor 2-alpha kinase 1-like [Diabrotica undecimpunctata]|uniref:eukaryotic translation initiation factor 2-alpha kinase 1-like n=1 Tax=Diabrotica undecimpunctata TaxID=50387 RepID=UPI003B63F293
MSSTTDSGGISIEFTSEDDEDNNENLRDVSRATRISKTAGDKPRSLYLVPKPTVSIQTSLLIESLIKHICSIYESNSQKAEKTYKLLCDKLCSMNLIGESYSMNEFEGIRSQYQTALFQFVRSVNGGNKSLPLSPIWPKVDSSSHYCTEFEEVDYIAGGGFGKVFKVKHKLDGTEYAIKKIPIQSEGIESVRTYLSEVKTFASMNHSNIVQYKGAWLEIGAPKSTKVITHKTTESTHQTDYFYHQETTQSFSEESKEDSTDFRISFEHSVSGAISKKDRSSKTTSRKKRKSLSEGDDMVVCKLDLKEIEKIRSLNRTKVKWATLYIQMALCQMTLKQWLEQRNSISNPDKALVPKNELKIRNNYINQILFQLLNGLEYIHSKDVVHHDIKPSNIFIQMENGQLLIQLGDFGLACPLQSVRHSLAFGTKLYAAPEQLEGQCDKMSDMYSLGIVLFELIENFRTDMERVKSITELRNGHTPTHLSTTHPQIADMIKKLIVNSPELRPNTTALLQTLKPQSEEVEQLKVEVVDLREDNAVLRQENGVLREEITDLRVENAHLKELLKMHGIHSV